MRDFPGQAELEALRAQCKMTDKVFSQVMAIRAGGTCNMMDTIAVQRAAYDSEFYELVLFIEEHKAEYVRLILTGHCD
jgi:hypothetical protein